MRGDKVANEQLQLIKNTLIERSLNRCKLIADPARFLLDTGRILTELEPLRNAPVQRQIELRIFNLKIDSRKLGNLLPMEESLKYNTMESLILAQDER